MIKSILRRFKGKYNYEERMLINSIIANATAVKFPADLTVQEIETAINLRRKLLKK